LDLLIRGIALRQDQLPTETARIFFESFSKKKQLFRIHEKTTVDETFTPQTGKEINLPAPASSSVSSLSDSKKFICTCQALKYRRFVRSLNLKIAQFSNRMILPSSKIQENYIN